MKAKVLNSNEKASPSVNMTLVYYFILHLCAEPQ
jgi:hypothetical protein